MGKRNNYKNVKSSLGKSLIQSRFSKSAAIKENSDKWLHSAELTELKLSSDKYKNNLKSLTEQNSLDEFLATAELAGTEFESEKLNLRFAQPKPNIGILSKEEQKRLKDLHQKNLDLLRIPRRPVWKGEELDAQTLQLKERESFLEWRRNLAVEQERQNLSMTPYEKNIEFWRQLWRVIERSDVIVQIVDARNPLLFYCADLETYCKEISENKINLVLINKSDFLTQRQRLAWLKYFEGKNVRVVFWSAAIASEQIQPNLDELESENGSSTNRNRTESNRSDFTNGSETNEQSIDDEEDDEESDDDEVSTQEVNKFSILNDEEPEGGSTTENEDDDSKEGVVEDDEEEDEDEEEKITEKSEIVNEVNSILNKIEPLKTELITSNDVINTAETTDNEKADDLNITDEERDKCKILNCDELIDLFKTIHKHVVDKAKPGITTIGLVGYPNVGKSSTINSLIRSKKVAVSETPGKTKHYQTIYLDDDLLLCDCPGLVFPSFVSTRGELIINGILPIDQMRDYCEPMNLLVHHIPKNVIEMIYGIEVPKPRDGEEKNRLPTAEEVCSKYSIYRGYMNHKGMPDVQRGARIILKDYVNGKLLYCYPPPGHDSALFQDHRYEISKEIKYMEKAKKIQERLSKKKPEQTNFDKEFFESLQPKALTKGGIVGYHRKNKIIERGDDLLAGNGSKLSSLTVEGGKPWKKHFNHNKREKLRRKTSHFDQVDYY